MKKYFMCICMWMCYVWGDTLYFQNGSVRGNLTIKEDTYVHIVYQTENSAAVKIPSHIITRIEYSDAPVVYSDGHNALLRGDYTRAIKLFQDSIELAKNKANVRTWIHHYASFYRALAYQNLAEKTQEEEQYQKAWDSYQQTIETNPQGHFALECHLQKTKIAIQQKKFTSAQEEIEKLRKASDLTESKDYWLLRLAFLKGDLAKSESKFDIALKEYADAKKLADAQKKENIIQEAVLAIGSVYIAEQDFSQAERYFSKLSQEYPNQKEIEAGVKNGLALCAIYQKNYKRARSLALDVFIKYPQVVEQQPLALYILIQCYENSSSSQIYKDWLKSSYPNSEWAKKIK